MPLDLQTADTLAARIVSELEPLCDRIQIAGSIRRRRPQVNDIDLVLQPKHGELHALQIRVFARTRRVSQGDQVWIAEMRNGVQIDIWLATPPGRDLFDTKPGNFGSLLLCRTGSKGHNIRIIEHAKRMGLTWNPHHGVFGKCPRRGAYGCLASETEEDIFRVLQLEFVPPEKREV